MIDATEPLDNTTNPLHRRDAFVADVGGEVDVGIEAIEDQAVLESLHFGVGAAPEVVVFPRVCLEIVEFADVAG